MIFGGSPWRFRKRFDAVTPACVTDLQTLTALTRGRKMAAPQVQYLNLAFLKDKPHNTPNWVSSGIERTDGFETAGEAQAVKAEYKDASGVVERKDGRFYVFNVLPN
jgi:hypothetical protein